MCDRETVELFLLARDKGLPSEEDDDGKDYRGVVVGYFGSGPQRG